MCYKHFHVVYSIEIHFLLHVWMTEHFKVFVTSRKVSIFKIEDRCGSHFCKLRSVISNKKNVLKIFTYLINEIVFIRTFIILFSLFGLFQCVWKFSSFTDGLQSNNVVSLHTRLLHHRAQCEYYFIMYRALTWYIHI